tara:strand:+ start:654 stop:911 length:258 start_codon:yes stop_codon:yes gene_type:complete
MKLFFYKSILILFLFLVGFHYSFNYVVKTTKNKIENTLSKEKIELLEKKIKEEMQTAIDKSTFISKEDANLINKFLDKIKTDLNK